MSRYGITTEELKNKALNLQIGGGIADRISDISTDDLIEEAEDYIEERVQEYIAIQLNPLKRQNDTDCPEEPIPRGNYPRLLIDAIEYKALSVIMRSEFFENSPNTSESAAEFERLSEAAIKELKDNRSIKVGKGRLKNPNPFVPPNIAPKFKPNPYQD